MTRQGFSAALRASGLFALLVALALPAAAQSVTSSDIQRLQDDVYQASSDLYRMRGSVDVVSRMQGELDDLRDEVVYLKVKLRREGTVSRTEYTELRDRIQDFRTRARGDQQPERQGNSTWGTSGTGAGTGVSGGTTTSGTAAGTRTGQAQTQPGAQGGSVIPAGQEIDARLQTPLSSATAQPEQRFEATTVVDLYEGNNVLIPAGSVLRGVISSVTPATRTERKGALTVAFDQVTVRGRSYPMRGTVTQALESEGLKGEVARIGAGAGVGAIIGGILGGAKGALIGVLIGGGGTIAATEGKDVTLPAGTILRVRLDSPPNIR